MKNLCVVFNLCIFLIINQFSRIKIYGKNNSYLNFDAYIKLLNSYHGFPNLLYNFKTLSKGAMGFNEVKINNDFCCLKTSDYIFFENMLYRMTYFQKHYLEWVFYKEIFVDKCFLEGFDEKPIKFLFFKFLFNNENSILCDFFENKMMQSLFLTKNEQKDLRNLLFIIHDTVFLKISNITPSITPPPIFSKNCEYLYLGDFLFDFHFNKQFFDNQQMKIFLNLCSSLNISKTKPNDIDFIDVNLLYSFIEKFSCFHEKNKINKCNCKDNHEEGCEFIFLLNCKSNIEKLCSHIPNYLYKELHKKRFHTFGLKNENAKELSSGFINCHYIPAVYFKLLSLSSAKDAKEKSFLLQKPSSSNVYCVKQLYGDNKIAGALEHKLGLIENNFTELMENEINYKKIAFFLYARTPYFQETLSLFLEKFYKKKDLHDFGFSSGKDLSDYLNKHQGNNKNFQEIAKNFQLLFLHFVCDFFGSENLISYTNFVKYVNDFQEEDSFIDVTSFKKMFKDVIVNGFFKFLLEGFQKFFNTVYKMKTIDIDPITKIGNKLCFFHFDCTENFVEFNVTGFFYPVGNNKMFIAYDINKIDFDTFCSNSDNFNLLKNAKFTLSVS